LAKVWRTLKGCFLFIFVLALGLFGPTTDVRAQEKQTEIWEAAATGNLDRLQTLVEEDAAALTREINPVTPHFITQLGADRWK